MAAFITSANPPQKDALSVRQFNICQYDLLGSTQVGQGFWCMCSSFVLCSLGLLQNLQVAYHGSLLTH